MSNNSPADTEARDLYLTIGASVKSWWVRGCSNHYKTRGKNPSEGAIGADFGDDSKYLNENFEGEKGKRFYVNALIHDLIDPKKQRSPSDSAFAREFQKRIGLWRHVSLTLERA